MRDYWHHQRRSPIFWMYIVLSLAYVVLAMHLPVSIYTTAIHDDAWFIGQSQNILSGHWLGDYNQMTLIKGVGFPYFLLLNSVLGVPITITLALLYLAACFFISYVLKKLGLNQFLIFILFAGLIFQPALLPIRIIRDGIYFSLLLISLAELVCILFCNRGDLNLFLVAFSGFCFGMFWITREEGVWVLPGIGLIILWAIFSSKKIQKTQFLSKKSLLIYFGFALLLPTATGITNAIQYGRFGLTDVYDSSFVSALNALNNVQVGAEVSHVPVPYKKREAIYQISPAFDELKDYFENTGKAWTAPGCAAYPNTCADYAGGWFFWALRDGVNSLGYYRDPSTAAHYYERLVYQIQLACQNELLRCATNPIPYLPRLTKEDIDQIPQKIVDAVNITIYRAGIPISGGPSWGPEIRLQETLHFLGDPRSVDMANGNVLEISGWYKSLAKNQMTLVCENGQSQKNIQVEQYDRSQFSGQLQEEKTIKQNFTFQISGAEKCQFIFLKTATAEITLANLIKSQQKDIDIDGVILHVDAVRLLSGHQVQNNPWLKMKADLIRFYAIVAPGIFYAGLLAFVATLVFFLFKRCALSDVFAVAILLWILYFCRIILVVMVDVSSFPAVDYLYLMPAFPLWMLASAVSFAELFSAIKVLFQKHALHSSNL